MYKFEFLYMYLISEVDQAAGEANGELDETLEEEESESPKKQYKTKFDWGEVMHQVLKKKGEISVKKLRKKVPVL